jgi:hypothetical protein
MPDKPFVINDRRKFTAEGELRHDLPTEPRAAATPAPPDGQPVSSGPRLVTEQPAAHEPAGPPDPNASFDESSFSSAKLIDNQPAGHDAPGQEDPAGHEPTFADIPAPTPEQTEQVNRAYDATTERLDTAIRAQNLGAEHAPPITFQAVVQTLFMQALMMLGGASEPGQPVSVDPMGARQIIDMIAAVVDKAKGNLTPEEDKFCQSILFELRMGFLDITQRLARQAATKSTPGTPGAPGMPGPPGGPNLVR